MLNKIDFEKVLILGILTLVSGFSILSSLFFFFEIEISNVYNGIFILIIFIFLIGLALKKIKLQLNLYLLFFLFFCLYVSINFFIFHDDYSEVATKKFLLFLGNGFLVTIISSTFHNLKFINQSILFFALLNIILYFVIFFFFEMPGEITWYIAKGGVGIDLIYLSRAIALGFVVLFLSKNINIIVKFILACFSIYVLINLNEVGPLLGVIIVVFTYFIRKNFLFYFLSIFLFFLGYFFVIIPFVPDLTFEQILQDPRVDIYNKNINYFLQEPLVGIGLGGSFRMTGTYQSAHNIFIEILTEIGIFGFMQFGIFIFILAFYFLKNIKSEIAYIWLYTFIVVLVSGDISLNQIFWFSSILLVTNYSNNLNYKAYSLKYTDSENQKLIDEQNLVY